MVQRRGFYPFFPLIFVLFILKTAAPAAGEGPDPADSPAELARRLYDAVNRRDAAETAALLAGGAPPDTLPFTGQSAFHQTVIVQDPGLLRLFLDHGADTELRDPEERTALMYCRDLDTLQTLLDAGADPLARDRRGKTALHYSAGQGDWRAIPLLTAAGVPVDTADREGLTPLMDAVDYMPKAYNENILYLLEAGGADPLRRFPDGKTVLHRYLEGFGEGSWIDQAPSPAVVQKMLEAGLDPGLRDDGGGSALIIALRRRQEKYVDTRAVDLIIGAARPEDLAALNALANRRRREAFRETKLPLVIPSLVIPLTFAGLSIAMREGAYRDNPAANWMIPVNSFLTFGAGAAAASAFLLGGLVYAVHRGEPEGASLAITLGIAAGITGFVAGTAVSMIPAVRELFITGSSPGPGLYYLPAALIGAAGGIILLKVSL
jgi:ankyrin repeat protein